MMSMVRKADEWADQILLGGCLSHEDALRALRPDDIPLLALVMAAYRIRERHFGRTVRVHVISNAANGGCTEDCAYCAQGVDSVATINGYPMKDDLALIEEARCARRGGAYRICLVYSGRGPDDACMDRIAGIVSRIKAEVPIEVCVSAGILDPSQLRRLKSAGLDRLNHNLNTTAWLHSKICTTHSWRERVDTISAARDAGLALCSGIIVGMGEGPEGVVELLGILAGLRPASIPVNFLVPIPGTRLGAPEHLTPAYCLRVLCVARLLNPAAEIRAAGGREVHLRSLQALALYPANSLFMDGYLNTPGADLPETLRLIRDGGFEVEMTDGPGSHLCT